ncbi:hypothetical protein N0V90_005784 [Kalmusia sp. IMI 367209]|nr:hypothetical protein N0V90_005784 [Kalmusia sp. IMI 367209]
MSPMTSERVPHTGGESDVLRSEEQFNTRPGQNPQSSQTSQHGPSKGWSESIIVTYDDAPRAQKVQSEYKFLGHTIALKNSKRFRIHDTGWPQSEIFNAALRKIATKEKSEHWAETLRRVNQGYQESRRLIKSSLSRRKNRDTSGTEDSVFFSSDKSERLIKPRRGRPRYRTWAGALGKQSTSEGKIFKMPEVGESHQAFRSDRHLQQQSNESSGESQGEGSTILQKEERAQEKSDRQQYRKDFGQARKQPYPPTDSDCGVYSYLNEQRPWSDSSSYQHDATAPHTMDFEQRSHSPILIRGFSLGEERPHAPSPALPPPNQPLEKFPQEIEERPVHQKGIFPHTHQRNVVAGSLSELFSDDELRATLTEKQLDYSGASDAQLATGHKPEHVKGPDPKPKKGQTKYVPKLNMEGTGRGNLFHLLTKRKDKDKRNVNKEPETVAKPGTSNEPKANAEKVGPEPCKGKGKGKRRVTESEEKHRAQCSYAQEDVLQPTQTREIQQQDSASTSV